MVGAVTTVLLACAGAILGMGVWFVVAGSLGRRLLPERGGAGSNVDLRRLSLALVAGLVVLVATRWFAAATLVTIGVMVFEGRLGGRADLRDLTAKSEAIASWIEMVYSTIAAGGGIERALIASARNAPRPLRDEVGRLAARLGVGSLTEALRGFASEVAHPAADKVAVALVLASTHGSQDLVSLLRTQVESTRLETRMTLEVEAGRARYRTSARIVVAVTALMAVGLYIADRGYLAPYDSPIGQLVLVCVGAVFMLGFWLLIRMADTSDPDRYFASVTGPTQVST
jgi:tight adherence protein B